MNRKIKAIVAGVVFLLLTAGIANAQQIQLLGTTIPKFMDPLPVGVPDGTTGGITVLNATSGPLLGLPPGPNYQISMSEFQAQILPVSLGLQPSWVWGYLTNLDRDLGGVRPSYLGPVVVAQRDYPVQATVRNDLPLYPLGNVQPLLPIDLTLDWANPVFPPNYCAPDVNGNYTNTACGPQPVGTYPPNDYPYMGPIPETVHLHGSEVAPADDGGPESWFTQNGITGAGVNPSAYIAPNGYRYNYPNGQQEATIWFHPHGFGITRLTVYAGMAGAYPIVDPANPPLATMPAFPQYDIPLIIQDRSFDTTGQIFYNLASNPQPNPTIHPFWIPEFIGDAIVVNGKTWPYLNVEPRQYRFRLLNGSNARFYDLTLNMVAAAVALPGGASTRASGATRGANLPFIAIATDSGYLVNAVSTSNIIIGPGERYEVIVDFTGLPANTEIIMKNSARTPFPGGAKPTANGTDTIMKFIVSQPLSATPNTAIVNGTPIRRTPLEPILNGFVAPSVPPAAFTGNIVRQLTLNEVLGPTGGPLELVVNNSKYNLNAPPDPIGGCTTPLCRETELPAVGDTEVWEIINITADAHPMHTHLTSFQLLDRTPFQAGQWITQYDAMLLANGKIPGGGPPNPYNVRNTDGAIGGNPAIGPFLQLNKRTLPLPYEKGWKDTVITYPGEVTRFVVRWAPQDAPVAVTAATPLCTVPTPPGTLPTTCVPQVGSNTYPFEPGTLINGVGYVWHCHILDHEDNEMMRTYTVMGTRQPVQ